MLVPDFRRFALNFSDLAITLPQQSRFISEVGDFTFKYSDEQPRDDHGRWTNGGGTLDERLVDFKPDRSLSDPSKIESISTALLSTQVNAQYEAYSQMPFLGSLHQEMGVADPLSIPIADYVAKRDAFFQALPVTDVPLDHLVVTQQYVNRERVQEIRDHPETGGNKPLFFVRYNDKTYVINGHHRVVAAALSGDKTASGHIWYPPKMAFKYSPDQPRDERGRWTDGGGTASSNETTEQQYRDSNGNWTAERAAMHQKLVDEMLRGVPDSESPTVYMLGGGPAVGKSRMVEKADVPIPDRTKAVYIDPDGIKHQIPEYSRLVQAGDVGASAKVHEEASYISKLALAASNKKDVVFDSTGNSSIEKLTAKIAAMHGAGQQVVGYYATTSVKTALARAEERGQRTGRYVPTEYLKSVHRAISANFPKAYSLFDRVSVYDTEGTPKLIFSADKGQSTIHDAARYKSFLAKGKK